MDTLRSSNGMCRCCASEGTFKDIKTAYHWMGEEEIYSDMLRECFDIILYTNLQGDDGGICEVCITQLRNASNFKKQVLHTEQQFKLRLSDKLFKEDIVKVEVGENEENESDNDNHDVSEDFSEYEVPIKTESDEPKTKKRAAKASTSRAKKAKVEDGESSTRIDNKTPVIVKVEANTSSDVSVEPGASAPAQPSKRKVRGKQAEPKRSPGRPRKYPKKIVDPKNESLYLCLSVGPDKTKVATPKLIKLDKDSNVIDKVKTDILKKEEIQKHLHNLRTILYCSNATPISSRRGKDFDCPFCSNLFPEMSELKTHIIQSHRNVYNEYMSNVPFGEFMAKLDVAGLKCTVCNLNIPNDNLKQLVEHIQTHDEVIHGDVKDCIIPIKYKDNQFHCVVCSKSFVPYKVLVEHMKEHYKNFTCDVCGLPYITPKQFQSHRRRHEIGECACDVCDRVFASHIKMIEHKRGRHGTTSLTWHN